MQAFVPLRLVVARIENQLPVERPDRLLEALQFDQRVAALDQRIEIRGVARQGGVATRQRFRVAAERAEHRGRVTSAAP